MMALRLMADEGLFAFIAGLPFFEFSGKPILYKGVDLKFIGLYGELPCV